jgi:choline dehydrogenase
MYPQNQDFDGIKALTGDNEWDSANMRKKWTRIENNLYSNPPSPWDTAEQDSWQTGYEGWQYVSRYDWAYWSRRDPQLRATRKIWYDKTTSLMDPFPYVDPNRLSNNGLEGFFKVPIGTRKGFRTTHYQYIKNTLRSFPDKLFLHLNSLATKVIFNGLTATGVEYITGPSLYKADPRYSASSQPTQTVQATARKEVIISGGTFNSPQLLKLSGVGPKAELQNLGIPVVLDLPGVGTNMHDRYEVGVNYKMANTWKNLNGCTFQNNTQTDPCYKKFYAKREGQTLYSGNGLTMASVQKSTNAKNTPGAPPDVVVFMGTTYFAGYFPGYAYDSSSKGYNSLAALVLTSHTKNRAGTVTLRSTDPRDVPEIRFKYFDEGSDSQGVDMDATEQGVLYIRNQLTQQAAFRSFVLNEQGPLSNYSDANIRQGIKDEAWGHHACCSNPMLGSSNPNSVVDSKFRVIGLNNLRIVDASVFPNIPGYFIMVSIYQISEKATDDILEAAGATPYG